MKSRLLDLAIWYPWSHFAREALQLQYKGYENIEKEVIKQGIDYAVMFIRGALEGESPLFLHPSSVINRNAYLVSYPFANALVSNMLGWIREKYAGWWKKRAEFYLQNVPVGIPQLEILEEIGRNTFAISFKRENNRWLIDFVDYLNIVENGELYMLDMEEGTLYLTDEEFIYVLSEALKHRIMEITALPQALPAELKYGLDRLRPLIRESSKISDTRTDIPPCMKYVMDKLQRGENPTHIERLALAIFLVNREWSDEDIIRVFSRTPDFNEKKVKYYIEHIRRRGYLPHGCDKIRATNFCFADSRCNGLKNPLQYPMRKS